MPAVRAREANSAARSAAHEALSYYLIDSANSDFRIQFMVDAFAAETADGDTKPITLVFALVGLCLHLERGFSGVQVQRAHGRLAASGTTWPRLSLPEDRGTIGIEHVIATPAGPERDMMIERWCGSVWLAYHEHHDIIRSLADKVSGIDRATKRGTK